MVTKRDMEDARSYHNDDPDSREYISICERYYPSSPPTKPKRCEAPLAVNKSVKKDIPVRPTSLNSLHDLAAALRR